MHEFILLLIVSPFTSIIDQLKSAAFHPRNDIVPEKHVSIEKGILYEWFIRELSAKEFHSHLNSR